MAPAKREKERGARRKRPVPKRLDATDGPMHVEAAEALDDEPVGRIFGYCFYHRQDVERALEGGALHITFDHVDGEVPERLKVGRLVEAALRGAGFPVNWDGTTAHRVALPGFRWQRRGPG